MYYDSQRMSTIYILLYYIKAWKKIISLDAHGYIDID